MSENRKRRVNLPWRICWRQSPAGKSADVPRARLLDSSRGAHGVGTERGELRAEREETTRDWNLLMKGLVPSFLARQFPVLSLTSGSPRASGSVSSVQPFSSSRFDCTASTTEAKLLPKIKKKWREMELNHHHIETSLNVEPTETRADSSVTKSTDPELD